MEVFRALNERLKGLKEEEATREATGQPKIVFFTGSLGLIKVFGLLSDPIKNFKVFDLRKEGAYSKF